MVRACGLGLLLALLLPLVGASKPVTVVRLNKAVLSYVSELGRAPLQQALQVTVPYFMDWSGGVLQPTRVRILNIQVTHLHLNFIEGLGVRLLAAANFTIKVFRVPEPLELVLPAVLLADARVAQGSIGTPVVSISTCLSLFNNAIVLNGSHSLTPALLVRVQQHIKAVLRNKLCLGISNLVQGLNVHLGTLIGLTPVGPESQVRYYMINTPNITNDYISLDINAVLFLLGKPIVLPVDATPFMLPEHAGNSSAMVSSFLSPPLLPQVARQFPNPMPLVLKLRLGTKPVATLHTNNATLWLQPFVEVLAVASNSAFQSLFSFNVVMNLSLQLSVSKAKLLGTTSVLG
ncbi:PREDICTED: BPI fold-containing family B member 2 [Hipposideros armiger]|uniref:BPI fold-containing family B member 2 n=1 Tax=Hipposideros armiger TaxID=186990 RepID=A0A8B7RJJ7_HIPAR|nr:PREDICTED: BPI fold-containing family B member 2 [Hipposideros armiger]